MSEIPDLLRLSRDAARQMQGLVTSAASKTGHEAQELLAPLQRQSELIEQLVRRQLDVEQQLLASVVAPAQAVAETLDKTPDAMRAQAAAFRAAAASFEDAAALLEVQATAIEQSLRLLKTPVHLAGRGLGRLTPGSDPS